MPTVLQAVMLLMSAQKKAAEKKESESTKEHVVQVDDLLTFRQFSKKSADDPIDVGFCHRLILCHSFFFSTWRTWARQRGLLKSGKTSYPISVVYPSSQVCLVVRQSSRVSVLITSRFFGSYICGSICQDARIRHYAWYAYFP